MDLDNISLYGQISFFVNELKIKFGLSYDDIKKTETNLNNTKYLKIDLTDWKLEDKELLFLNVLKGINIWFLNLPKDNQSIPIGGFKSVIDSILGNDILYIYPKFHKGFNPDIKKKVVNSTTNSL